ncbi:hypothetical protein LWI29_017602 [Acer saccharum]|uniref:Uncharacterized protein n=1 Tax=Acer saccharum TaxID=4024 RepID=A0AA39W1W3_ACESA|nr:hypothetical protein LWI29_017602 [Acer saccharum]
MRTEERKSVTPTRQERAQQRRGETNGATTAPRRSTRAEDERRETRRKNDKVEMGSTADVRNYGQRPEEEKNFSKRPCCHSRHHRTATVAIAFEWPVVASAAEEPIRTGSDDRAAFVASTITPFLVELYLTGGDATIVSVGRFAAEIG